MDRLKVASKQTIDSGLRQFLLGVYNYMGLGLALTAMVVVGINFAPSPVRLFFHNIGVIAGLAALGLVIYLQTALGRMSVLQAQGLFWVYAALVGVSVARFLSFFSLADLSQAFFVTSLTFIGSSIYGYTTKSDMTRIGSFLTMGLIGIFVAAVINVFFGSSLMSFVISSIAVVLFTILTAYDTQRLRDMYFQTPNGQDIREKLAVVGALALYLDVINIFLHILNLIGLSRRD